MNNNIKNTQTHTGKLAFYRLAVFALAVMGMTNTAQADNLYKTSFEQPTFMPGDLLSGTDGWSILVIPPFLNPNAAVITRNSAKGGRQSVEVPGASLTSAPEVFPYDAVGVYRRPLIFKDAQGNDVLGYDTASGNKKWARVDADLMLETPKEKTNGQFFSLTISARAVDGSLGEIGLSSAGVVEAFAYNALPGGAPIANCSKTIGFNKWYHITLLHDFVNRVTSYYIDDDFLCAASAPRASTILQRGSMGVFARPDGDPLTGPNSVRSDYNARFDKYRISIHYEAPEID